MRGNESSKWALCAECRSIYTVKRARNCYFGTNINGDRECNCPNKKLHIITIYNHPWQVHLISTTTGERMRWIFSSDCMIAIPGLIWHPRDTDSIKQSSHNNNNNKYSIHDYLGSTMRSSTTGRSHNGSLSGNIYLNAKREKKLLEFLNLILTFFYWKLLRVENLVTYAFYHLRYWEYERLDLRVCNVPCTMTIIIHCYCTSHNNLEPMLQTLTHIQSTQHVWL